MTFDEACSKGTFIKRPDWPQWVSRGKVCHFLDTWCVPADAKFISMADLNANDWESTDDV